MTMHFKTVVLGAGLMMSVFQVTLLAAGEPKQTAAGPIPTQISSAKKVFIANGGENQPFYNETLFNGGSERAYDQFYAGMKAAGRYELVSTPADADLLFEIELTVLRAGPRVSQEPSVFGDVPYDPQFRLVIRDPKTNAMLWTLIEHVQWAILQGNRDKNFDQAAARIVNDVQGLAARSAPVASAAKP
jgi:hypothetical protein